MAAFPAGVQVGRRRLFFVTKRQVYGHRRIQRGTGRRHRRGRGARRRRGAAALRTKPKLVQRPYITRKIPLYEVLSEEGLQIIENNADTILEEIGIEFRDDEEA